MLRWQPCSNGSGGGWKAFWQRLAKTTISIIKYFSQRSCSLCLLWLVWLLWLLHQSSKTVIRLLQVAESGGGLWGRNWGVGWFVVTQVPRLSLSQWIIHICLFVPLSHIFVVCQIKRVLIYKRSCFNTIDMQLLQTNGSISQDELSPCTAAPRRKGDETLLYCAQDPTNVATVWVRRRLGARLRLLLQSNPSETGRIPWARSPPCLSSGTSTRTWRERWRWAAPPKTITTQQWLSSSQLYFCALLFVDSKMFCVVAGERALRIRVAEMSGKCSGGLSLTCCCRKKVLLYPCKTRPAPHLTKQQLGLCWCLLLCRSSQKRTTHWTASAAPLSAPRSSSLLRAWSTCWVRSHTLHARHQQRLQVIRPWKQERGLWYFCTAVFCLSGVVEVYRVTRRVELGIKATAVCSEKLQQLLKDISRVWNNLMGFMSLAKLAVRR